jgi:hypothetical protein
MSSRGASERGAPAAGKLAGKIVVAHPERRAQRMLHRLVGAARWPVEVVPDLDALEAAVDAGAIAVVEAGLARARPGLRARPARAWIAVPAGEDAATDPDTVDALLEAGWTHIVAHPMPLLAEELSATVLKLARGEAFGLEKYLAWAADVRGRALADAGERGAAVAALSADVIAAGLPERMGSLAGVIADELLANALYAAPIDAEGRRFRAREPRDRARPLADRDGVTIRWGTDARYLAIEVRDRWGSLEPAALAARLVSGDRGAGGGGMGLHLVYACSTQLVIGAAPAALTEIIALLDLRYRPMELGRSTSFHVFRGAPPAHPADPRGPERR